MILDQPFVHESPTSLYQTNFNQYHCTDVMILVEQWRLEQMLCVCVLCMHTTHLALSDFKALLKYMQIYKDRSQNKVSQTLSTYIQTVKQHML